MTAAWFFNWWNLIFLLPFLLALLYLTLYTVSGLGFESDAEIGADGHLEADAHVDADVHADAGADAHVDADADADADVHADADTETDTDAHTDHSQSTDHGPSGRDVPLHIQAMAWIGVGKAPLSILLVVLLLSWGLTGFFTNAALWERLGELVPLASLPTAFVASILLTGLVGKFFARYLPIDAGAAEKKSSLVGAAGRAVFSINENFGLVAVRGQKGELYQLPCRTYGDREPIDKGTKVLLVDYDADRKMFYVTRDEIGTAP